MKKNLKENIGRTLPLMPYVNVKHLFKLFQNQIMKSADKSFLFGGKSIGGGPIDIK